MRTLLDIEKDNLLFCGDFNAIPSEKAYKFLIEKGFKSTKVEIDGKEWDKTFPSGLIAPKMDKDGPMCLDYIW